MYASLLTFFLALSGTASAYTIANVTVNSQDPSFSYAPSCPEARFPDCQGAWWTYELPDGSGPVMMTSGPDHKFGGVNPYWTYTFRGTDVWAYQWVNASTTDERAFTPDSKFNGLTTMIRDYPTATTESELTLVLAFSFHGLDPLTESTIGLQFFVDPENAERRDVFFDHLVVSTTTLDAAEMTHHKSNIGVIAGAVVGSLLGITGLVLGGCLLLGWKRRRDARKARARGWDWKGSNVQPGIKFMDPSAEIEHSERMAREGRLEEMAEKNANDYKLPPIV